MADYVTVLVDERLIQNQAYVTSKFSRAICRKVVINVCYDGGQHSWTYNYVVASFDLTRKDYAIDCIGDFLTRW